MTVFWVNPGANGRLAIVPRPRGNEWLRDDLTALRRNGIDILVSLLTRPEAAHLGLECEQAMCEAAGIEFRSFPIPDHSVPTAHREMHELAESLATERRHGKNIGAHCCAGIGRSVVAARCGSLRGRHLSGARLSSDLERPRVAGAGYSGAGGVAGGVRECAASVLNHSG